MALEEEISQVIEGKTHIPHHLGNIKEMNDRKAVKRAILSRKIITEVKKASIVKENTAVMIQVHIQVNLIR